MTDRVEDTQREAAIELPKRGHALAHLSPHAVTTASSELDDLPIRCVLARCEVRAEGDRPPPRRRAAEAAPTTGSVSGREAAGDRDPMGQPVPGVLKSPRLTRQSWRRNGDGSFKVDQDRTCRRPWPAPQRSQAPQLAWVIGGGQAKRAGGRHPPPVRMGKCGGIGHRPLKASRGK
jgi:hypothetical protein